LVAEKRLFVLLLREPHAVVAASQLKSGLQGHEDLVIGPPPSTGLDFFTCDGEEARQVDAWWAEHVGSRRPVVLAMDEPGLVDWLSSPIEADFVIGVSGLGAQALYGALAGVSTVASDDPRLLAEKVLERYGPATAGGPVQPPPPAAPPAAGWGAPGGPMPPQPPPHGYPGAPPPPPHGYPGAPPPPPHGYPGAPPPPPHGYPGPPPPPPRGYPPPPPSPGVPGPPPPPPPGRTRPMPQRRPATFPGQATAGEPKAMSSIKEMIGRLSRGSRREVSADFGSALVGRHPPICVAVVSRKGGVGKTAVSAAIGAIFGEAVDALGATACLVDANIGNPDAWGRIDIQSGVATVREVVTRLVHGQEPPPPSYARTPALAVYPEARDASNGYTPAQLRQLAEYLRSRHAGVVVDLPNRLPGFNSPEAAIAASWIAASDVVVLPTTADPAALTGVLEYLATENLRTKPAVVAYTVPRLREVRDATEIRSMVEEVRARSFALIEVPDDDRAMLALIRHVAITEVSPPLRHAYLRLADAVVAAASAGPRPRWGGPV
jgi:MinD-like ATPase involved in chromosome partitioning or flagellar assembly